MYYGVIDKIEETGFPCNIEWRDWKKETGKLLNGFYAQQIERNSHSYQKPSTSATYKERRVAFICLQKATRS